MPSSEEPRRPSRSDGGDTRSRILVAAYRRVARDGYATLSLREIARDAGVNHALINYHFQTKDNLVLAVLDEANRRLLARQNEMYRSDMTFAEKWAHACRFYEDDLNSGFVRLMMELFAASFSNPALRAEVRPRHLAWRRLVDAAVRDAIVTYRLEVPASAEAIGAWIGAFWMGMELEMMLDIGESEGHHREALQAMQDLLAQLGGSAAKPVRRRAAAARPPAGKGSRR
ncbi:MAG: TetR/AcrR family transcriptional regulator [Caldimonas sp.]